jgi:hypothetical protein
VATLRQAFLDTYKDPQFVAEAKKARLDIQAVTGQEMEQIVAGLFKMEPKQVARLKEVLVP